jgi:hypothetical protein
LKEKAMGLSLEKKSELVRLNLEKRKVPAGIKLAVKTVIDVSGSIKPYFDNGTMQELVDRLIPVGMRFDDDGAIESYAFGSRVQKLRDITTRDFGNYIKDSFKQEVRDDVLWTGTSYSNALSLVDKNLGGGGGFLGFGAKKLKPSYMMFITDGDTQGDERETDHLLAKMADKKVYIQMIGVGRGSNFTFLNNMADKYGHVGFVTFPALERTTDEAMYEALLGEELCGWIKVQQ